MKDDYYKQIVESIKDMESYELRVIASLLLEIVDSLKEKK